MNTVYYISGPQKNIQQGYWLYDFLKRDYSNIKTFSSRINDLEKTPILIKWIRIFKILLYVTLKVHKEDLILVYGEGQIGLYLGLIFSVFRPSIFVYKINCMANNKEKLYSPLKRFFVRQAFKNIYTTTNNEEIANIFSSFLNIPRSHFIPIPDSTSDFGKDLEEIKDNNEHGYIFMGGATNRDYNLFIDAAKRLPHYKFLAVTFEKNKYLFKDKPQNLTVEYGLEEKIFYQRIANSSLVFIPLNNNMQGGQLVLFQGALLKKCIMTSENVAIKTYFSKDAICLIPIGDIKKAIENIIFFMEHPNIRKERGIIAYNQIKSYTPEKIYNMYKEHLFPHDKGLGKI